MRTQLGGGAQYNIARNWKNYGRATSPQVGAVVVWPHHVGMITGRSSNGKWIGEVRQLQRRRPRGADVGFRRKLPHLNQFAGGVTNP